MGIGHKLVCENSFSEKAYAILAYPDCVFSDGTVARMQELARQGKALVVCPALRFGEEPLLEDLRRRGLLSHESRRDTGLPLVLPARDLTRAAINSLHAETLSYEWDASSFGLTLSAVWWRVPNEEGMLLHGLNWSPLLLDFASFAALDTSTLESWSIDGDFLDRNVSPRADIHVVDDSDEAFLASWAPTSEKLEPIGMSSQLLLTSRTLRELIRAAQLRRVYYGPYIGWLKRRLFLHAVRWHARPFSEAWQPVERKASQILGAYVDEVRIPGSLYSHSWNALVAATGVALSIVEPIAEILIYRSAVGRRFSQILRGNPAAVRRVLWHVDRALHQLFGRTFSRPMPKPPA
jgi:hypothetical protein